MKTAEAYAHPEWENESLANLVKEKCEPFDSIPTARLEMILDRIGDSRLVLLGEASHGTSEFYEMRARISQALIARKNFNFVAVEADWPDAEKIDRYVRHRTGPVHQFEAFSRFPEWMWRNREVQDFTHWLHEWNLNRPKEKRAGFHGLDLYSLHTSINSILHYLEQVDLQSAARAREHYSCLQPFMRDPVQYGAATLSGLHRECADDVTAVLRELLQKRLEYIQKSDEEKFFNALQNARVVEDAEKYYKIMYYGSAESWNLRDRHMFETLKALLDYYGENSKGIVWAHNSHLGDASATDKEFRDELNVGQLCREEFARKAYLIGFGTDHGTVAAASAWGEKMEIKKVRPSLIESYEHICHRTNVSSFFLPLQNSNQDFRDALMKPRLERAIGVIYRPETERLSHYFYANLPEQFDEYIWFDESSAVHPLDTKKIKGAPETYPFGL
ncbi:MAG: uncharacterized protein JWQ35_331 [Bacteriovoracaceae bacterium]|nr:uncharacterized protein [Bacteriovoracaceae bacterium]